MATDKALLHALVRGHVQGVYFRDFTARHARSLGLSGYVRNLPDGRTVEVLAEGERALLERLVDHLRRGPPEARVQQVETEWQEHTGVYEDFRVRC